MFDIAPSELLVVGLVALVVIGPKDLPRVMRHVGRFVGKARGMARHFRSGFDEMVREAELEEMERHWRNENDRIMRDHAANHPPLAALPTVADEGGVADGAGHAGVGAHPDVAMTSVTPALPGPAQDVAPQS